MSTAPSYIQYTPHAVHCTVHSTTHQPSDTSWREWGLHPLGGGGRSSSHHSHQGGVPWKLMIPGLQPRSDCFNYSTKITGRLPALGTLCSDSGAGWSSLEPCTWPHLGTLSLVSFGNTVASPLGIMWLALYFWFCEAALFRILCLDPLGRPFVTEWTASPLTFDGAPPPPTLGPWSWLPFGAVLCLPLTINNSTLFRLVIFVKHIWLHNRISLKNIISGLLCMILYDKIYSIFSACQWTPKLYSTLIIS